MEGDKNMSTSVGQSSVARQIDVSPVAATGREGPIDACPQPRRFTESGIPVNPFDTEAWLDYLADHEHRGQAIDRLLEEEPADVVHELVRWAVNTHIRLTDLSNQAGRHLAEGCLTDVAEGYWSGVLAVTDPAPACFPSMSDSPF